MKFVDNMAIYEVGDTVRINKVLEEGWCGLTSSMCDLSDTIAHIRRIIPSESAHNGYVYHLLESDYNWESINFVLEPTCEIYDDSQEFELPEMDDFLSAYNVGGS